ncbi:hypothetical protein D9M68_666200 [compost metagenome]
MGRDFDGHAAAIAGLPGDFLFVLGRTGCQANRAQALFFEQALDQRGAEFGADGIGTLDAQCTAVIRWNRQGGEDRPGQGVTDKAKQQEGSGTAPGFPFTSRQGARHAANTLYGWMKVSRR